jgi:hypothetical protein
MQRRIVMAISEKYGKLSISKIGENEPVFILRAQDVLAANALEVYRLFASSQQLPIAKSLEMDIQEDINIIDKKRRLIYAFPSPKFTS